MPAFWTSIQTPSRSRARGPRFSTRRPRRKSLGPAPNSWRCDCHPGRRRFQACPGRPHLAAGCRVPGLQCPTRQTLRGRISSPSTVWALRGGGRDRRSRALASTVSGVVAWRGKGQANVPSAQAWPSSQRPVKMQIPRPIPAPSRIHTCFLRSPVTCHTQLGQEPGFLPVTPVRSHLGRRPCPHRPCPHLR